MDEAVIDDIVLGEVRNVFIVAVTRPTGTVIAPSPFLADVDPTSAQVVYVTLADHVTVAIISKPDAVFAHVGHFAVLDDAVSCPIRYDPGLLHGRCLATVVEILGKIGVRVPKLKVIQMNVLDVAVFTGETFKSNQALPHQRRHDYRIFQRLVRQRMIGKYPRLPVQIPFSRLIQSLGDILHVITQVLFIPPERPTRRVREPHGRVGSVQAVDVMYGRVGVRARDRRWLFT